MDAKIMEKNKFFLIIGVIIIMIILSITAFVSLGGINIFEFSDTDKGGINDEEDGENSEVDLFIGTWKTTIYYVDVNGTRFDEPSSNSTFYNNGTMGSETIEAGVIIWTPYVIENNEICFGEATALDYLCYYYEFSDNGTKATLVTYFQDPNSESGATYMIVVEMIRKL